MKKNFTIFILLALAYSSYGQLTTFSYDIAGNQTAMYVEIQIISPGKMASASTTLQNNPIYKDVKYYPNPVKSELYMEWQNINDNSLNSIVVFNIDGKLLKEYRELNTTNNYTLPFQDYPQGVYFVEFLYSNGEQKSFKIIKQE
jgi:GH24 family phage-related lysozyme (muramidase)